MNDIASRTARGSLAGIAATLPMSGFMLAAQRAGWLFQQAPEQVTAESIEEVSGNRPRGSSLDALTVAAHLAFGLVAGALYALTVGKWHVPKVPAGLRGAAFGTAVWASSYWGVLPSLGIMPPPHRDERSRPMVMLVAHWIYGGLLGAVVGARR
jgi:hypothetical protein